MPSAEPIPPPLRLLVEGGWSNPIKSRLGEVAPGRPIENAFSTVHSHDSNSGSANCLSSTYVVQIVGAGEPIRTQRRTQ